MGKVIRTVALATTFALTPGCGLLDGPSEADVRADAIEDAQDACSASSQETGQQGRFSAGFIDFTCRRFRETVEFEFAVDPDITGDHEPSTGSGCNVVLGSPSEAVQVEQEILCDTGSIVVPADDTVGVETVIDVAEELTSLSS